MMMTPREFRKSLGLTLKDMASVLHISLSWLSKVEQGIGEFSSDDLGNYYRCYPGATGIIMWPKTPKTMATHYKAKLQEVREYNYNMQKSYNNLHEDFKKLESNIEGAIKVLQGTHYAVPKRKKKGV